MSELEFPKIGNALLAGTQAAYYGQKADAEAADERRKTEAQPYLGAAMKGDSAAMGKLAYGDPKAAIAISTALQRMDANQRAQTKEQMEWSAGSANAVLQAAPAERAQVYANLYAEGQRRGYKMTLPPQYSPEIDPHLRSIRTLAVPISEWFKQNEGMPQPMGGGAPAGGGGGQYGGAISGIESAGGPNNGYGALGPIANQQGDRAYGKFQVMGANVGPWTKEILGKEMTPQEFLANPDAQNKVFEAKFGQYVTQYGSPQAASRAWFAGPGGMNNPNARDVNGMTPTRYEQQFTANAGGQPAQMPNAPAGLVPSTPAAPMPGAPTSLTPPGPPPAQMPSPAMAGTQPVTQGDANGVPPGAPAWQAEFNDVRRHIPAGWQALGTKKHGPAYDSQGRLRVINTATGEETSIDVPKKETNQPPAGPFSGNAMDAQAHNIVLKGDPTSPEYAAAYAHLSAERVIQDPQSGQIVRIKPDISSWARPPAFALGGAPGTAPAAPPVAAGGAPVAAPAPAAAPGGKTVTIEQGAPRPAGGTELAKMRDMEAEGNSIIAALGDFSKEFKAAGTMDRVKSAAGVNTPLNTSFSNAALLAKGEALYNLGVLNGPDLDIIRRTLPDPSSLRSATVSADDMQKSVDKIITLIKTRLAEKKKSLGVAPAATGDRPPLESFGR